MKRKPAPLLRISAAATASARPPYYEWRQKFGGLQVNDTRRVRLLEEENRKLEKLVADQALDAMVLKEWLQKGS